MHRRPHPKRSTRLRDVGAAREPDAPPTCRHFGTCGGCSLLDQPIAWQLHDKVAAVERLLAAQLDGVRVQHTVPDRTPRHFRTRLLYPVRADRDGLPIVGIYAFRSHEIVRIEECRTQDLWLTAFGRMAEGVLREMRLPPFRPDGGRGVVKALFARLASGTGQVCAGVVTRPGEFAQGRELAERLCEGAAALRTGGNARRLVGVVHGIRERDDEFLLADRFVPLKGSPFVVDRRDGLEIRIGAGSFYQIHADAHELLHRVVLDLAGDLRGKRVVDGYGGVGAFGLRLAKAGAASVLVVEDNASACRDAEHNAKANALPQVTVVRAPFAGAALPPGQDLVLVDPPRAGLQAAGAAKVLAAAAPRVLHVACDAGSLAQDVALLREGGYRVRAVHLCDLFPHTEHVELVTLLERAG